LAAGAIEAGATFGGAALVPVDLHPSQPASSITDSKQ
jgi:hypothetical protein